MRRLTTVLLLLTLLMSFAVSAQEVTVEPTVEVTAEVTDVHTDATATPMPTMQMEATAEATAEMMTDQRVHVRFAHFAPDAPAVQVSLNGEVDTEMEALEYPSMSDWMTFDMGTLTIAVLPEGGSEAEAVLGPTELNLLPGTWQTIAVIGTMGASSLNAVVVQEAYDSPFPGTGGLTFLNALEGSPSVDFHRGDVVFYAAIDYPAMDGGGFFSSLLTDSGNYDFSVTANEDPNTTFAEVIGQELEENAYTFMALIGTLDAPELFIDVTDRAEVEIGLGTLREPGTLLDALASEFNFMGLTEILAGSDLAEMLSDPDAEYTLFAPADFTIDELGLADMSDEQLSAWLQEHLVEGRLTSTDLVAMIDSTDPITTLAGTPLVVTLNQNDILVNGSQIIDLNIPATNGIIHMLGASLPE